MATKKVKQFKCTTCGETNTRIGVTSLARQNLNVQTDEWTDLEVGETLHGFCLECAAEIPMAQFKKLTGIKNVEPDHKATLIDLVNSAETEGCDNCATVSLEALNKARLVLGWKKI